MAGPAGKLSLPRVDGWEAGLGTHLEQLRGARVAVVPDWGGAVVSPVMWELLEAAAEDLIADCGMTRVDGLDTSLPRMGAAWSVANSVGLVERIHAQYDGRDGRGKLPAEELRPQVVHVVQSKSDDR